MWLNMIPKWKRDWCLCLRRFYCLCLSFYISKMSVEWGFVFSLMTVHFRFYTIYTVCIYFLCTYTHLYVCICGTYSWFTSPSRPCDWPAAEGGCGYCCPIRVHVYAGGGWLPSLSLPVGERTEEPVYTGNANTNMHTFTHTGNWTTYESCRLEGF